MEHSVTASAIHLITRGIRAFLDFFPDKNCEPSLANEYNRILDKDYASVRDFIVLHYCSTQRQDSGFWQRCQQMTIPGSLAKKLALFRARGLLEANADEFFKYPSWYSIFEGMQINTGNLNPLLCYGEPEMLANVARQIRTLMQDMATNLPTHIQFLSDYCLKKCK